MLGVIFPFSYTKLTILILDECSFLKNGNKFVITLLIISRSLEYFDVSEIYFLTSLFFFLSEVVHVNSH